MKRFLQFREYDSTETFIFDTYNEELIDAIKQIKNITNDYPCEVDMDFEIENIIELDYEPKNFKEWYQYMRNYCITYDMCETPEQKLEMKKYLKVIKDFYGW